MCPVSCLTTGEKEINNSFNADISDKLGFHVSAAEAWSFIDGFDGNAPRFDYQEANAIGAELRAKYITKE